MWCPWVTTYVIAGFAPPPFPSLPFPESDVELRRKCGALAVLDGMAQASLYGNAIGVIGAKSIASRVRKNGW